MNRDWLVGRRPVAGLVRKLRIEALEDRRLLASADFSSQELSQNKRAAVLVDDGYEQNDTRATAKNLGTLTSNLTINNLVQADANDWYRFTTTAAGSSTASVSLAFLHAQGDLDLELYNAAGTRLKISQGITNGESVSLSGLATGTYYVGVYGYRGVTNPNYSLAINLGGTTPAPTDDSYENNDTQATAVNLGTLTSNANLANLALSDAADWFRFTTTATGTSADSVSIGFQNAQSFFFNAKT